MTREKRWAKREPHKREYIGKNEVDGSVVLRVVLSDSIPSDLELLPAIVEKRLRDLIDELKIAIRIEH